MMLTRLLFALITLLLLAIPVVQQGIAQGLNGRFSYAPLKKRFSAISIFSEKADILDPYPF